MELRPRKSCGGNEAPRIVLSVGKYYLVFLITVPQHAQSYYTSIESEDIILVGLLLTDSAT